MNVVFVEPFFPSNQRQFARALAEAGATVIGIGEYGVESFDDDLKGWLHHYERVSSVTDVDAMTQAVRWVQDKLWVDRLEATIEAHTMAAAQVREACTIPGTSVRTAWLCRDKPSMKEALREAGVPTPPRPQCHPRLRPAILPNGPGFPLILKPRSGAGASGTVRVDSDAELDHALGVFGGQGVESIAVEEFVEGHEGFYDTIAVDGRVALDFVSHYYPNVLEAMRTRWISPQFVSTNRVDTAPEYGELREMGRPGDHRARHRHLGHAHGVVLRAERAAVLRDRLPAARRGRLGPVLGGQRSGPVPAVGRRDRARLGQRDAVPAVRQRDRGLAAVAGRF